MLKTRLKKGLSLLLALVTLFSFTMINSAAKADGAEPLFTLSDVQTRQGEEFEVVIKIAKDISPTKNPVASLDVVLSYDKDVYEIVELSNGEGLNAALNLLNDGSQIGMGTGYVYSCSKKNAGVVKWSMATLNSFTFQSGKEFMTIHFKAKDRSNLDGDLSMNIKVTNAAGSDFVSKTDSFGAYTNKAEVETNLSTLCDWTYNTATNSYILTKFHDTKATYYTVPDVYDDPDDDHGALPVTSIAPGAFRDSAAIEKIILGKNIKTVGSAAFFGCASLKKLVVYSEDTAFGANSLYGAHEDFVVKCIRGSKADLYATKEGIKVEYFEDLSDCTYTGADEVVYYTGSPVYLQDLKILNTKNEALQQGSDYTITYTDNVEIGTASILISAKGEYLGTLEIKFEILCPYHVEDSEYYTETNVYEDCEKSGKVSKNCHFCGFHDETEVLPAKGHAQGEWVVDKEPTCKENGLNALVCPDCKKHLEETEIEKLENHTPADEWAVTKAATCTQKGTKALLCTSCGEVLDSSEIAATGHTAAANWVVTKEATCTQKGTKALLCIDCGEVLDSSEIAATGHTAAAQWVVTKEATCTQKGAKALLCTSCGEVLDSSEIAAKGHTSSSTWVVVKQATCSEAGEEKKLCTVCGETSETRVINKKAHTPGEWQIIIEPTCEKTGFKHKVCSVCESATAEQIIPVLGHTESWVVEKLPTYKVTGKEKAVCSTCKKDLGKTRTLAIVVPDVDLNGSITSSDALLVLQFATGIRTLTDAQKKNADLNGDGKINSTDALLILQYVTGQLK